MALRVFPKIFLRENEFIGNADGSMELDDAGGASTGKVFLPIDDAVRRLMNVDRGAFKQRVPVGSQHLRPWQF